MLINTVYTTQNFLSYVLLTHSLCLDKVSRKHYKEIHLSIQFRTSNAGWQERVLKACACYIWGIQKRHFEYWFLDVQSSIKCKGGIFWDLRTILPWKFLMAFFFFFYMKRHIIIEYHPEGNRSIKSNSFIPILRKLRPKKISHWYWYDDRAKTSIWVSLIFPG